ncbi:MAG: V-type ATP synthase subunit E family protein [Pseudomonadota bacterium]|nr:V-type ATP synthase subunit E family protein [Pseudomonadota bacterium]
MNTLSQSEELEAALIDRAATESRRLLADARRMHDEMLAEAAARIRAREQRETRVAREQADRLFRQRVQAGEMRLKREIEWLRWRLVHEAVAAAEDRFRHLAEAGDDYLALLGRFLASAVEALAPATPVAELNARDLQRVGGRWQAFCSGADAGTVELSQQPIDCTGGIRVRDGGDTVRVDYTIEARLDRMQEAIRQIIAGRLFQPAASTGQIVP